MCIYMFIFFIFTHTATLILFSWYNFMLLYAIQMFRYYRIICVDASKSIPRVQTSLIAIGDQGCQEIPRCAPICTVKVKWFAWHVTYISLQLMLFGVCVVLSLRQFDKHWRGCRVRLDWTQLENFFYLLLLYMGWEWHTCTFQGVAFFVARI